LRRETRAIIFALLRQRRSFKASPSSRASSNAPVARSMHVNTPL
jgi:hypothetical protein